MRERSATVVVHIEEFYDHAGDCWQQAFDAAAVGMTEPLQVKSFLTFCRNVDEEGNALPVTCTLAEAKYACCMVTAKDLSESFDPFSWEPLCTQSRPKRAWGVAVK